MAAVTLSAALVGFQVALAAGAPWGEFAWGGSNAGVLPRKLRVASGVSALLWTGALVAAASRSDAPDVRRVRAGYGVLAAVGTLMNAASPSVKERLIWTPVAAGLALSHGVLAVRPGCCPAKPDATS
ncbi:MAG TPA: hypothetical protein DEG88_14300 [Propionibacteriaceae bacterium]|nr:hypothetical protein [Micropruina sp.]HBX82715.1 hypothetical protein [Propionibacteriaceae bacterium]HBY24385.1 hypothetical protein [Propionibacteriaceae bacterium]